MRTRLPRGALADWSPVADRVDPVDLIEGQAATRDHGLIPLRHARMGESAFAFYRGTAIVMARDLASKANTGPETQLCGDAHLSNFGLFASEDRRVVPMNASMAEVVETIISSYRDSLNDSRRHLLDRFHVIDLAHKVVGVGSIGLFSWVLLLEGTGPDDILVLQVKQAQRSVIDTRTDAESSEHDDNRVVEGQRLIQAAGDVFLGWTTGPLGRQYYVRQLRDMKWSPDPSEIQAQGLLAFARLTGAALARAHAWSGDPVPIAAYLGLSDRFDRAVADFAVAYADQAEADYAAFQAAIASGRLRTASSSTD